MDSYDSSPLAMRLGPSGIGNFRTNNSSSSNNNNASTSHHNQILHQQPQQHHQQPLSQVDRLRQWRQDALMNHHYRTAEYVGDKILTLTGDANDAYWLAKVHFASGNYGRVRNLLISRPEMNSSLPFRYLVGLSLCNMGLWDEALEIVGETNNVIIVGDSSIPGATAPGTTGGIVPTQKSTINNNHHNSGINGDTSTASGSTSRDKSSGVTKSVSTSHKPVTTIISESSSSTTTSFAASSSAAAARSAVPLIIKSPSTNSESTNNNSKRHPSTNNGISAGTTATTSNTNPDILGLTPGLNSISNNGIKIEASICFLRGQIYTNDNNFDLAKQCYREAVQIDAKCYEAFDQLIQNNLMTPQEEWDFLRSLDFDTSLNRGSVGGGEENSELVKALYSIRLGKYTNLAGYKEAENLLKDYYGLSQNSDVLLSRADLLFIQCRYKECLKICEEILKHDKFKFSVLPNYLSCLYELGSRNRLFQLAHELVELSPQECVSWQAVGVYYMAVNKVTEARRYFSKASMMNPYFAPAWIGFAHTFAAEGEHEQAISAYSTAARLFPGTHLPTLFLGMQHLHLNNITLAEDYLATSYGLCKTDPLLLNEMGVAFYEKRDFTTAEAYFMKALQASAGLESDPKAWLSIKANLGHVHRRLTNYDKSLAYFEEVLRVSPKDSGIYTAIGLVNLQAGRPMQAIGSFHDSLSITPGDPVATDLLSRALVQHGNSVELAIDDDDEFARAAVAAFDDIPELSGLVVNNDTGNDSQMEIESE